MKFNRFIGILSGILFIIFIVSIAVISLYVNHLVRTSDKDIGNLFTFRNHSINSEDIVTYKDIFKNGGETVTYNDIFETDGRTAVSASKNFEIFNNIKINASVEDVIFIEEVREDILVECYHEKPDTSSYKIKFNLYEKDDTIIVDSNLTMRNLHIDNGYTRTITVYVPLDYSCENYEINMNFGSISKDSFPANIQNLTVSVDAGEAVFDIDSSIDHFEGDVDAGQMTITTNGPINHMDLQCDLGEIVLVSNAAIDTLNIDVDAGAIDFTGKSTVSKADISTNLGEFSGTFYGRVGKMEASVDLGSINLHLHANDDSTAHVDVDLGDIDCDLPIVKSDKNPTFDLTANLGSITVVSE